jgi:hypothetical protein
MTLTTEEFVRRSKDIHGETTYDYSCTVYHPKRVEINCPSHGVFKQFSSSHLSGRGCARCANKRVSKAETKWLDGLGVEERQYRIILPSGKRVFVDGYDPDTNTVYEFLGDFWHGNPAVFRPQDMNTVVGSTFGELHAGTQKRLDSLRSMGFKVEAIWESDLNP